MQGRVKPTTMAILFIGGLFLLASASSPTACAEEFFIGPDERFRVEPSQTTSYLEPLVWKVSAAQNLAVVPEEDVKSVDEVEGISIADRLEKLEKAFTADALAEAEKKSAAAGKPSLKINGRIHLDYWNFADQSPGIGFFENPTTGADPEDRLFFRRIRLTFQGDLFDTMLYRMQIDFNAPDSGEMKDMYIGFQELPVLGTVLMGNQKRPLGLDHLNSSRFNIFIERPLVIEAFNEDARRLGIAAYNHTEDEVYNWRYGVFSLENLVREVE